MISAALLVLLIHRHARSVPGGPSIFWPDAGLHNVIEQEDTGVLWAVDFEGSHVLPNCFHNPNNYRFTFGGDPKHELVLKDEDLMHRLGMLLLRAGCLVEGEGAEKIRDLHMLARRSSVRILGLGHILGFVWRYGF